jgi:hypothetical protein
VADNPAAGLDLSASHADSWLAWRVAGVLIPGGSPFCGGRVIQGIKAANIES